jgi:hypothetical protein
MSRSIVVFLFVDPPSLRLFESLKWLLFARVDYGYATTPAIEQSL